MRRLFHMKSGEPWNLLAERLNGHCGIVRNESLFGAPNTRYTHW